MGLNVTKAFTPGPGTIPRTVAEPSNGRFKEPETDHRQIRLILAEDSVLIREGLLGLFAGTPDIDVVGRVADGRAALEACLRFEPDLLLTELQLPKLHGIDLVRQLVALDCPTRVIGMSNRMDPHLIWHAVEAGVDGLLHKAAAFGDLTEAIERVAAGGVYLEAAVQASLVRRAIRRGEHRMDQRLSRLTSREREIAQLLVQGMTPAAIARDLCLSIKTVDSHRYHLLKKTDCRNVADLTRLAVLEGLIRC